MDIKTIESSESITNKDFDTLVKPHIEGRSKEDGVPFVSNVDMTWFATEEGLASVKKVSWGKVRIARLAFILTHPEYRNKGVATKLTQARIDWARDQGFDRIVTIVAKKEWAQQWADFLVSNFGFSLLDKGGVVLYLDLVDPKLISDRLDRDVVGFD